MRGEPGSARSGGQDGVPSWSVGPPDKRQDPFIPKRQAMSPSYPTAPQSRRSERHGLGGPWIGRAVVLGTLGLSLGGEDSYWTRMCHALEEILTHHLISFDPLHNSVRLELPSLLNIRDLQLKKIK
ncbi:uncharacterized protein WM277_006686 isoform 2-T3 [Molossus nigricans]